MVHPIMVAHILADMRMDVVCIETGLLHDVEGANRKLRELGLGDREIFEATAFVAFRLAFSTINDALGAAPDKQLADTAPTQVRAAFMESFFGLPGEPSGTVMRGA